MTYIAHDLNPQLAADAAQEGMTLPALVETNIDKESHPDSPMAESNLTKRLRVVGEDYAADEEAPNLNAEQIEPQPARPQHARRTPRSHRRRHPVKRWLWRAASPPARPRRPRSGRPGGGRYAEWRDFAARLDACPSERVTGYSYLPSQKAVFLLVSFFTAHHSPKGAHRYVQTLRICARRSGSTDESRSPRGKPRQGPLASDIGPKLPSRQTIVKFIDHWLRVRADWVIPLIHNMVAQIAFRTIIDNDLNITRIVLDTTPIRSGLRKQGKKRRDPGAKHLRYGPGEDKKTRPGARRDERRGGRAAPLGAASDWP